MPGVQLATTAGPPRRTEFATSDPAEVRDVLDHIYGAGSVQVLGAPGTTAELAFEQVEAGEFTTFDVKLPGQLSFAAHGQDDIVISTVICGTVELERGNVTRHYQAGDAYIASQPRTDLWYSGWENLRATAVMLPAPLLAEAAAQFPGGPRGGWEFLASDPVSADGLLLWRKTTRFVDDLLADAEAACSPLLVASAGHLLAATAVAAFPNTAHTDPAIEDRRDADSVTLRRAVAFIDEHAQQDITIADIAAAAFVTVRAVQLAFRRHMDTTPMAYLRRVRLNQAHRELQAADPVSDTVTAVAYRWGFPSPARFAAYYRSAYGVPPSQTLRR
jgi:AraC-like DNA-binding protein